MEPEPLILGEGTRVMSLRDGTKKMSKSEESENSRIGLSDDAEIIAAKIKKAKTDTLDGIFYDVEKRPEISNLLSIYSAFSGESVDQLVQKFASYNNATFKNEIAELLIEKLTIINEAFTKYRRDEEFLHKILRKGVEKSTVCGQANIEHVKQIVGLF